ncbi:MAG: arsenate reductase [Oceanicoccus sp.]|jgi:arsenate reductase
MKLLFICTHNRCRSILAEAITNAYGTGILTAKSAGSQPVGEVHPLSLKYLTQASISTAGLCSQSWDEHESWQPDVVITVCDSAAGEPCPAWFGNSLRVHWGLADPSRLDGTENDVANAFNSTIATLKTRILKLIDLDIQHTKAQSLAAIFAEVEKL